MATRQERIDAFSHDGTRRRTSRLSSFVRITSVPMLFRSCADGAMAPGEASILTNASKPQSLVGECPVKISAEP